MDMFMFTANLTSWIPGDVPQAMAFMQYNLAVCYATRGEFQRSGDTLNMVVLLFYIFHLLWLCYVLELE